MQLQAQGVSTCCACVLCFSTCRQPDLNLNGKEVPMASGWSQTDSRARSLPLGQNPEAWTLDH